MGFSLGTLLQVGLLIVNGMAVLAVRALTPTPTVCCLFVVPESARAESRAHARAFVSAPGFCNHRLFKAGCGWRVTGMAGLVGCCGVLV